MYNDMYGSWGSPLDWQANRETADLREIAHVYSRAAVPARVCSPAIHSVYAVTALLSQ
jgi:hypothetical protein